MCTAILQGHTSLVGQLQMRNDTLVTGGSDGSVRVWSLLTNTPIHRLAAHDNSVTSLQFDDNRIVSGGSDGRVKIWSVETGQLVRELSQPAEAVWRVAFEEEKAVIMASRSNRTVMEVSDVLFNMFQLLTSYRSGLSPHPRINLTGGRNLL
jgi:F-box and WD-40 domain protein CDC4